MKKIYIVASALAIMLISAPTLFADNTVGGSDQPWDNEDDDSTSVVTPVKVRDSQSPVVFDLNGRRVSSPQHGKVYIVSGKKIVWNK